MPAQLKSRKFWISVVASLVIAFAPQVGVDISQEQAIAIAGIVVAYVGSEAMIDRQGVTQGLTKQAAKHASLLEQALGEEELHAN